MKRHLKRAAILGGLACLLTATATAQSNDCGSATGINGVGIWPYSTQGASTDGASIPCGQGQCFNDVWFAWTAPSTDNFVLDTCTGTGYDSMLVAYSSLSGCSGAGYIVCNDDSCGLQSRIDISANSGQTYLIRIGGYGGSTGTGNLRVTLEVPGDGNPDVIVGDLMDMRYYGTASGISAYSLGTYSCNIGTDELDWIAGSNRHPVIGQNMYRYENGRFEQIGISWLKHGFTALQHSLCDTCQSSGTGSRLGVGCADPYTASLNGSQSGLGPRFEVNAHTGFFLYPFTAQGQTGGTIYKRLQVDKDDIDPSQHPNASYYGEAQYVTPDDAAAGNQNNNASWRPLVRQGPSGGGWDMDITSSTVRTEPAIYAWRANDAGVQLEDIQVPGEGLFIAGSRATDNGDGTWHYEYAVHNLNSDLSGQSFSVPTGSGLAITNIGFHDVDYHSGEPFSGTDWTTSSAGDAITWSCDTFATDTNANALRWGTMYNFRFDANAPPTNANGILGLFKPGGSNQSVAIVAPDSGAGGCAVNTFCVTSPNSFGPGALINSSGSASVAANNLTLMAVSGVPSQFGIFYYGPNESQIAFGNGWRCVSGGIFRLPVVQLDVFGQIAYPVDNTTLAGAGQFVAGGTWKFQFWYRDPGVGAGFNLSDGLSVTFCP